MGAEERRQGRELSRCQRWTARRLDAIQLKRDPGRWTIPATEGEPLAHTHGSVRSQYVSHSHQHALRMPSTTVELPPPQHRDSRGSSLRPCERRTSSTASAAARSTPHTPSTRRPALSDCATPTAGLSAAPLDEIFEALQITFDTIRYHTEHVADLLRDPLRFVVEVHRQARSIGLKRPE
jgi:hypothetical protein